MVQRILFHAVAVAALGTMCLAQATGGPGTTGSMNQGQPSGAQGSYQSGTTSGMEQRQETKAPSSMSKSSEPSTTGARATRSPDSAFIKKAAQGNLAEVALGNIAQQNGENQAVKQFGNRMVTDHGKANDELQQIARDKGVPIPSTVSPVDKQLKNQLQSKKGAAFDKTYASKMVSEHEKDIAAFRREAKFGKDPEVKAWAQKTLPVLEQHLTEAKQMEASVRHESGTQPGAMSAPQEKQQSSPQGMQQSSPQASPQRKY